MEGDGHGFRDEGGIVLIDYLETVRKILGRLLRLVIRPLGVQKRPSRQCTPSFSDENC